MNINLPIIASITAIVLAQGGCYETAMRDPKYITQEYEENVAILKQTTPLPEPTDNIIELPTEVISQPIDAGDPVAVHQGTHVYSGENFDNGCKCSPAPELTRNFEFSEDSVYDGIRVYQKTGENTYKYSSTGYRIEIVGGVENKVDTEEHIVYIFNQDGFIMQNYTDVTPGEGDPCCYYQFTLQD